MTRTVLTKTWLLVCAIGVGASIGCVPVEPSQPSGSAGTTGTAGRGGASGVAGASGSAGSSGFAGATGNAGNTGAAGTGFGGSTGVAGTGGPTGLGGNLGLGGTGGGAGATGGSGAGGQGGLGGRPGLTGAAGATMCTFPTHGGQGSFTRYYFAQGTGRDGTGYRTACGYYGTANGQTDTIENIASMAPSGVQYRVSNTYFAAIPGQNGFDSKDKCGACVLITGQNGTQIIATITDECPYGSDGGNAICGRNAQGHLDLSTNAFNQLGYPRGDPTGTNWRFVPCPVTGTLKVRVKTGNNNEIFIENTITAITAVTINGTMAVHQSYGAWHIDAAIPVDSVITAKDMAGREVSFYLASTQMGMNQDTGVQFPTCL